MSLRDRDRRSPPRHNDRFRSNRYDRSPPNKRRRDDDRRDWDRDRKRFQDDRRSGRGFGGRDAQRLDGPLLSFRHFYENQTDRPSVAVAQKRYDEYKSDYDKHNSRSFFKGHKDEEWFLEKYHPIRILERRTKDYVQAQDLAKEFVGFVLNTASWPSFDAEAHPEAFKVQEIASDVEMKDIGELDKKTQVEPEAAPGEAGEAATEPKEVKAKDEAEENTPALLPRMYGCLEPPPNPNMLFIINIPPSVSRQSLLEQLSTVGEVKMLLLTEPDPPNKFIRCGWVEYGTREAADLALQKLSKFHIKHHELFLQVHEQRFQPARPLLTPPIASTPQRLKVDLDQAARLVKKLDETKGISYNVLLGTIPANASEEVVALRDRIQASSVKQKLDLLIEYLSRVHWHCYYLAQPFPTYYHRLYQGELVLRPAETLDANTGDWEADLTKRTQEIIDMDLQVATGGKAYESALHDFYDTKIIKESEERYRCELCGKMFKTRLFVEKHMHNKHPETVKDIELKSIEEQFYRNYLTHSQRILPSHQYIFYDDDIKDIEKSIRERTPEDDRISPDRQGPNTDPRDRSRTDYSRGNDRSPGRRWSGGGSGGAPGGRRPARGGIIRKPEELRDLPPPPEFRDQQDPRTLKSYLDLDSNPGAASKGTDPFGFEYEKALADFTAGL